ncbi:MAG: GNAT family N-acetyltransferase [Candidatus Helarchaeales archaeon]
MEEILREAFPELWPYEKNTWMKYLQMYPAIRKNKGILIYEDQGQKIEAVLLAVHPSSQRKGIGSELLARLERIARKANKKVWLSCEQKRLAFYLKRGYKVFSVGGRYPHGALVFKVEKAPESSA